MASKRKLAEWATDNIVMLVGIPLIIGIHYGWSKLQDIPYLVDQSKKKEIPIVAAFRAIKNKLVEKMSSKSGSNTETEAHPK